MKAKDKKRVLASALAVLLVLTMVLPCTASAQTPTSFSDVLPTDYFHDAVKWAVENGVTTGTGAGKFTPTGTCTGAQAITFIWRAHGKPEPSGPVGSEYYAKAVRWAEEKGITAGTGFDLNGIATRAQIVTYLYRAAGSPELATNPGFSDVPLSAYYAKPVVWAICENVTTGTGNNKFTPDGSCTRGQVVTFMHRAVGDGTVTAPVVEPERPAETTVPTPAAGGTITTDRPGLAHYGITPNAQLNVPYTYTTVCDRDPSKTTTGTATFIDYIRKDVGDGYEEISVTIRVVYSDDNAWVYGAKSLYSLTDCYLYEDGGVDADIFDGKHQQYTIVWNGKTYDKCSVADNEVVKDEGWVDRVGAQTYTMSAKVPQGYDGVCVWVAKYPGVSGYGRHLDKLESLILFRCN